MPARNAVIRKLREAGVVCLNREQWGSAQLSSYINRRSTHPMPSAPAKYHYLHLTVTRDTDTIKEGKVGARQVEGYGYSIPPMVSYQDLITNEGFYFQGQDYGNKGTHTVNDKNVAGFPKDLNMEGYALALMQNVEDEVTFVQVQLAAMVFAARELTGWVRVGAPILPHRMFAAKSCPGDKAMAKLAQIQRLKDQYVRDGLPVATRGARFDRAIKELELAEKTGFRGKMRAAALASLRRIRPIRFVPRSTTSVSEDFEQRTLDWVPNWDEKNNLYTIEAMDCFNGGLHLPRVRRQKSVWLDQGTEGACTGFGTAHVIAADPLERPDMTNDIARQIYLEAQRQDEWPGENYSGSSVNGAMKAAQLQGFISEYRWCKTLDEVKHALSHHGPVVIGVNWYEGMFSPDASHFIHATGAVRGGHALMLAGYDGDVFRLENSWGPSWGDNGGCFISAADLERVLNERGEFACPNKIPL